MISTIQEYLKQGISFDEFEKLKFQQEGFGTHYKIRFGRKYENPSLAIENDDFYFETFDERPRKIDNQAARENLLKKLITKQRI